MLILLVEDEIIIAMLIQRQLKEIGFTDIKHVTTGENAIISSKENPPDIILMDIKLAGKIDGIEAAFQIKSEQEIPVIFITSYNDNDTAERVKKIKPLGYLEKPLSINKLKEIINSHFTS